MLSRYLRSTNVYHSWNIMQAGTSFMRSVYNGTTQWPCLNHTWINCILTREWICVQQVRLECRNSLKLKQSGKWSTLIFFHRISLCIFIPTLTWYTFQFIQKSDKYPEGEQQRMDTYNVCLYLLPGKNSSFACESGSIHCILSESTWSDAAHVSSPIRRLEHC